MYFYLKGYLEFILNELFSKVSPLYFNVQDFWLIRIPFLAARFSPMHMQAKPVGLPLIRNMQINLLIRCIESLRHRRNTWLAPMQEKQLNRAGRVAGVNCALKAHSQKHRYA